MNRQQEQLEEVKEEILDIEILLQLLEINLSEGEEDSYIKRSVRMAERMLRATTKKLTEITEGSESN
nr:hypothetical protein [uncultured Eisenbergiella sp.]